ncbi:MAG: MaoC family dehydratase N-terminal domain-containing protein [Pseudomonadota bacterium]
MDQLNLMAWEGRVECLSGVVTEDQAMRMHATLGTEDQAAPRNGDTLPALWHWGAFVPTVGMSDLGPDGHPALGDFLPPIRLRRRMWAGGELTFHTPLYVGEPLLRSTAIRSITEKQGRSGAMVFLTLDHEIHGQNGLAISERQDIVYLDIPDRYIAPKKQAVPAVTCLSETVEISEALLFRYSALTFNAHRIHYDRTYSSVVEHYPGLVVHGPLQATYLIDAATRYNGRAPSQFRFRGVHPMFDGSDLLVLGQSHGPEVLALCTGSPNGHQGMQATAIWGDV